MADKLETIVDQVAELSVLELSELVKALEEKFGVEAAAPLMMGAMPAAGAGGDQLQRPIFALQLQEPC